MPKAAKRPGLTQALDRMKPNDARTIAWIFYAICFWDKSPVTRLEIMHSADALDHLQPLESELGLALGFLTKLGLVQDAGDSFALTDAGNRIHEQASESTGNVYDVMKNLETYFSSSGAV